MPRGERINPPGVHTPQANYSHVTRVGDTLYISGQLPLDLEGRLVGPGDPEAQAEQCYKNIQAIVEHFGGTLNDIVKVNQYIRDVSHRPLLARPRDRLFGTPGPSSTLVEITALAVPEALIEIEAIAVLG
jgi:2-iminobutanoate/2-iminopropanoate deaminase